MTTMILMEELNILDMIPTMSDTKKIKKAKIVMDMAHM